MKIAERLAHYYRVWRGRGAARLPHHIWIWWAFTGKYPPRLPFHR